MGKYPVRLKEVVYTVSPFEVTVVSKMLRDFPKALKKHIAAKGPDIIPFAILPTALVMWYAADYKEKEKLHHRY